MFLHGRGEDKAHHTEVVAGLVNGDERDVLRSMVEELLEVVLVRELSFVVISKARLEIGLLGPLSVMLDGEPVTDLESDSVRALLAYLACEPGRLRSRAMLAEMLWPGRPILFRLEPTILRNILFRPIAITFGWPACITHCIRRC